VGGTEGSSERGAHEREATPKRDRVIIVNSSMKDGRQRLKIQRRKKKTIILPDRHSGKKRKKSFVKGQGSWKVVSDWGGGERVISKLICDGDKSWGGYGRGGGTQGTSQMRRKDFS